MKQQPLGQSLRGLAQELDALERTDPRVAAAAASFEAAKRRILEGRVHALPCRLPACPWHRQIVAPESSSSSSS